MSDTAATARPPLHLRYDRYLTNEEIDDALAAMATSHADCCRLGVLGHSHEGRTITLVTLGRGKPSELDARPALWVDGNIHATEFTGAMAALYLVDLLLTEDSQAEMGERLLDHLTVYVVPRLNPDGAALAMAPRPRFLRSGTRSYPWEALRPGLHAEDLDGDGRILQMRLPDPAGDWMPCPDDPRLMLKRRAFDQGGNYYRLFPEGVLEGRFDGHLIETAPPLQGLDFNRNFPNGWRPEGEQPGAGDHPGSEPEVQAVLRFFAEHRNIYAALTLHTFSRALLRPFSDKPDEQMDTDDLWLYEAVGREGTALTGYPTVSVYHHFKYHPKQVISGAFDDWAYSHGGVIALTVELWDLPSAAGIAAKNADKRFIEWFRDHPEEDDLRILDFVRQQAPEALQDWRAFDHPQLGRVELGGWNALYSWRNPPPALLEAEIAPVARFARSLGTLPARLAWRELSAVAMGDGHYLVRAALENQGYLSTSGTRRAREAGAARPVILQLEIPAGALLVTGQERLDLGHIEGRAHQHGLTPGSSPTDNRRVAEWLVKAAPRQRVGLLLRSDRGGTLRAELELP